MTSTDLMASVRTRISEALDASTDRCARCKTCGNQVDAVMAVLGPLMIDARDEAARLKKRLAMLENEGDRIGFAVVTYNQASHWPGFDYSDLHTELEDAENERDYKREETKKIGRGERHVIAEVIELRDGDADG